MVSIIIVNYKVKKELFACLKSIIASKPRTAYEIIVVDNDENKTIEKDLIKKFPNVKYIPNDNRGFGQGNNVGAKYAKGNYLFFLNPDTTVFPRTIDSLVNYLNKHSETAIVAPLLYDQNNKLYRQGATELTPLAAIFSFSILHTVFPNNPVKKKYWMEQEWDRESVHEVSSVPGTAFMVRKTIFQKIKGFDENFFMYFEEHDLCKRIKQLGWKIEMLPQAKVYHALGKSSKQVKHISRYFQNSRYYYFKKHFGLINAIFVEAISRLNKYVLSLIGILGVTLLLLLYRLSELMLFIGDQGWFYLSARDMVTKGTIPLVGIASSHPWLHQGALWTYMLALILPLFSFHPITGAYIAIFFGILSIIAMYTIGTKLFSQRIGLLAALLYATSPLALYAARMPYHTAPIPFFTLLYILALYKWLQGNPNFLPVSIFLLGILYNLELATFLFVIVFVLVCLFGWFQKKLWLSKSLTPKILFLSVFSFVISMLPMLIYDITHGFPQTMKFLVWNVYKIATILGFPEINPSSGSESYHSVILFIGESYQKLVYMPAGFVAFTIALFSFGFFYKELIDSIKLRRNDTALYILALITTISVIGLVATKTSSNAYLPLVFPMIIFITAMFFDKLITLRPKLKKLVKVIIFLIVFMNIAAYITSNTLVDLGRGLEERLDAAKQIVSHANGRSYNLVGKGDGSEFESYTMNYEYLTWWLGNSPSKEPQTLKFVVSESNKAIHVEQINKDD